jgi:hypothetical protein
MVSDGAALSASLGPEREPKLFNHENVAALAAFVGCARCGLHGGAILTCTGADRERATRRRSLRGDAQALSPRRMRYNPNSLLF